MSKSRILIRITIADAAVAVLLAIIGTITHTVSIAVIITAAVALSIGIFSTVAVIFWVREYLERRIADARLEARLHHLNGFPPSPRAHLRRVH